jgi:hypothetical protein
MRPYQYAVARVSGLVLVLLLFGAAVGMGVAHYGDRSQPVSVGATLFGIVFGLFAIAGVWHASRFDHANQVALVMVVLFLVGYPIRLWSDHVGWIGLSRNALVVVGALLLTFGGGIADEEIPMARWRRRSEKKGLPRLNRRRAHQGLPPVTSFDEARTERRRR